MELFFFLANRFQQKQVIVTPSTTKIDEPTEVINEIRILFDRMRNQKTRTIQLKLARKKYGRKFTPLMLTLNKRSFAKKLPTPTTVSLKGVRNFRRENRKPYTSTNLRAAVFNQL
jgi:hypothetical protein